MDLPDKQPAKTPVPGNPEKKIEQVASGVKRVQRPATRRFFDHLFAESPKPLVAKIRDDVIVPRLKSGFEEAFNSFLAGMLWGDSANRPVNGMGRTVLRGGVVNYNQMSGQQSSLLAQARAGSTTRSSGNYQDLVMPSVQMAEQTLGQMIELLNQYRVVAVADLYEMVDLTPSISDNGYGWRSLDGSRISKVRDGFQLELPRPEVI